MFAASPTNARPAFVRLMIAAVAMTCVTAAEARITLESICTLYGQRSVPLSGIGLVIGLPGTGDGPQADATTQALFRAMEHLKTPVNTGTKMSGKSVAIVMLTAEIPKEGVHVGQRIPVTCSSIFGAESLENGTLLSAPLQTSDPRNPLVLATAQGHVSVDDPEAGSVGVVRAGGNIEVNLFEEEQFLANVFHDNPDPTQGKLFYLLLDPEHATFIAAQNVTDAINADFNSVDVYGRQTARVVGPGKVEVTIPPAYGETPIEFVAEILAVGIDRPHTEARVVVNERSRTVIITGEAAISPVTISHPGLQIEVGQSFRTLVDPDEPTNNAQLRQLVSALGQLQVSTPAVIDIVRELHSSGKLHAKMINK